MDFKGSLFLFTNLRDCPVYEKMGMALSIAIPS